MKIQLTDGSGEGYSAQVTAKKRLSIQGVIRTQLQQAAIDGDCFNISTGQKTLTTDGESAIFYAENTGDNPLIISSLGIRFGATTAGIGPAIVRIYRNAADGTIVSNADPLAASGNQNFGNEKALIGSYFAGDEGYTTTGGQLVAQTQFEDFAGAPLSFVFGNAGLVMPKGANATITIQPPAGNTSQTVLLFGTLAYDTF